jgi:metal-dependent amidase/aminoacylase/carboxypeptidase family protein
MTEMPPVMGAEDFAFMLEACPGTMIAIGNGDTAGLHDPAYDFNDEAIPCSDPACQGAACMDDRAGGMGLI